MWFPQKEARIMWGKNYLFNKWHCKKLESYMQNVETGPLSDTIHTINSK